MIWRVRLQGRAYEAEIEDLSRRPVVVWVDGERFEIWPEGAPWPSREYQQRARRSTGGSVIRAPISGVIVAVRVRAGDRVGKGEEVCVLEAMKMRNPICAPRDGIVAAIPIAVGERVERRAVLVELLGL